MNKLSLLLFSFLFQVKLLESLKPYCVLKFFTLEEPCNMLELIQLLLLCHQHWVMLFPGVLLQLYLLCRSGLSNRRNIYTWCWSAFVNLLGKKGDNCVEILIIFVRICPYCSICTRKLVTPDAIQHILYFSHWIKAVVPMLLQVLMDNMHVETHIFLVPSFLNAIHWCLQCCFSFWHCQVYMIWT